MPTDRVDLPGLAENVLLIQANRDNMPNHATRKDKAVAKGQKRSNREIKKPKKTDAERLKAQQTSSNVQLARMGDKNAPKKS